MARSKITLDSETNERARQRSSDLGISVEEYLGKLIQKDVSPLRNNVDASPIFDLGESSEPTNIATDKDRLIGEAIDADFERSRHR